MYTQFSAHPAMSANQAFNLLVCGCLPRLCRFCASCCFRESRRVPKPMESQTSVSKRAPREFRNWRVQVPGNPLTLRQPFANPLPTLRQPFANLLPSLCQPFLPTPLQAPLSVDPRHWFRDGITASWKT